MIIATLAVVAAGVCAVDLSMETNRHVVRNPAHLNWPIASNLDPDKIHELEIRPVLGEGGEQEINIESVCVAGRNGAWVKKDN